MWDFVGPDVESEEVKAAMRRKRQIFFRRTIMQKYNKESHENGLTIKTLGMDLEGAIAIEGGSGRQLRIHTRKLLDSSATESSTPFEECSPGRSASVTVIDSPLSKDSIEDLKGDTNILPNHSTPNVTKDCSRTFKESMKDFLKSFFSPLTVSILISFPIALTPKLKALFVHVPGTYMPPAPDGQPPLSFLMDIMIFIGGAAIPMALICLGSSLARLSIPKRGEWRRLPLGAIGTLATGKLLIAPVVGVLMCQGLTEVGFIPRDDKVLRFVCM